MMTTSFEPKYKITNFESRVDGQTRVSIVMYLSLEIGDGNEQGKMPLKVVKRGN